MSDVVVAATALSNQPTACTPMERSASGSAVAFASATLAAAATLAAVAAVVGVRGCAAAAATGEAAQAALRERTVGALRKQAVASGVPDDAVERALDSNNPKVELIELILQYTAAQGPARRLLADLQQGGAHAVGALTSGMENALAKLEQAGAASPRKVRRELLELADRLESAIDAINAELCDRLGGCAESDLEDLCAAVVRVLESTTGGAAVAADVVDLLDALDRLGSMVPQSLATLGGSGSDAAADAALQSMQTELRAMRLMALQSRATAEGVDGCDIDDALEADNPKTALADLIVQVVGSRGPTEDIVAALQSSGEQSVSTLSDALEHGIELLEQQSVSSPRRSRKVSIYQQATPHNAPTQLISSPATTFPAPHLDFHGYF